jgi:stearoyl-CoA desaturase (Delta-9 desaturase)
VDELITAPVSESTAVPVAEPAAELPPRGRSPGRLSAGLWVANLLAVILPFLGLFAAAVFFWGWGFSWADLGLLLGTYVLTALGITVGFHRLFTHRSFQANGAVQFVLGVLGSMAVQGPLIKWVALHRRHHAHSDRPGDPHSPHLHGSGVLGLLRGLWHAHLGWLFLPDPPDLDRYDKDLRASALLRAVSALFPVWVVLGLALPAALGGVITRTWMGVWTGLVWGGLVRVFLVHHVTWSINSVCHLWGFRPYRSEDESRDNVVFGVLGMGEGWHNTHHAFPSSARHGLRWWQVDVSYYVIRALALLGLAGQVKLPSGQAQARGRRA